MKIGIPLVKNVLAPLGLAAAMSAIEKNHGLGQRL